jgi:hypothetical protein
MADVRGLEAAFTAASAEARRTYDILNGTGGRGGLEQKYLIALANKEKNDAKPGSVRNFNVKEFNALKASYDVASAAYKKAQDAKNATRLELNKAKGTTEKEKGAKDLVDAYNKAVDNLKKAEALIPSRGQAQYNTAVQAAYDAATAAKAAGGKIAALPKPATGVIRPEDKTVVESDGTVNLEEVANNKFKDYTINSDGSVSRPGAVRSYFISVKGINGSSTLQEYTSIATARDAFLRNYSAPGALDKLKQQLRSKNYISASQLASGDWIRGLDDMLGDYTRDAVTAVKYGGAKESPLIDVWFGKASGGTGSGSKGGTFKDTDLDLTTVGDAYKEINDYMIDSLGREATQQEKDDYYKDINARELKSAVSTVAVRDATGKITKSTRTGDFVTADERLNSKNAIVIKALEGTDAGSILSSAKGSQVAVQISLLQKAAADYGQPISAGEALKYVIAGGTQKDAIAKQTERMRLNAMTMFGNLKDHIRDGGTVKDIADQYARIKSLKLGMPITDAFNDKDVIGAITKDGGLMSTAEFGRQMQANPLWRQTDEARNTAADFANTILKSFGFMG